MHSPHGSVTPFFPTSTTFSLKGPGGAPRHRAEPLALSWLFPLFAFLQRNISNCPVGEVLIFSGQSPHKKNTFGIWPIINNFKNKCYAETWK